jgi:hypothetical protein
VGITKSPRNLFLKVYRLRCGPSIALKKREAGAEALLNEEQEHWRTVTQGFGYWVIALVVDQRRPAHTDYEKTLQENLDSTVCLHYGTMAEPSSGWPDTSMCGGITMFSSLQQPILANAGIIFRSTATVPP